MNGILCINKPQEYTSFDVIARIRGMSKTKRVGHSGTLDPMATGVLPVFIGIATKACGLLPDDNKCYEAAFSLGTETDTLDCWGTVKRVCEAHVHAEELTALLPRFTGEIEQIPPMYSAVRVNGQRLYDIARQGREVGRAPRRVTVMQLSCTAFDEEKQTGTLSISCSKGTYIRSIISDIGAALGCGAMMTGLVRVKACGFTLEDCITLDEAQAFTEKGKLASKLLPVDRLFYHLPRISLNEVQTIKFKNGVRLDLNRIKHKPVETMHRVYAADKAFLGLASLEHSDESLRIEKLFIEK